MSVAAPARRPTLGAGNTLRNPSPSTSDVMTRRAWFLVVGNLLLPGSAQTLAGSRRLGRFGLAATLLLWALLVVGLVVALTARWLLLTAVTLPIGLTVLQLLAIGYAALWTFLTLDTLRLVRLVRVAPTARIAVAVVAVVGLVATAGTAAYGAMLAGVTRDTVFGVFRGDPAAAPVDGRYNILLLGGDAGPDRQGLRPDSISVVSVDAASGKVAMFGLPRDLNQIPFSDGSPMQKRYPDGYGTNDTCDVDVCELNSIYTEVQLKSPELYPDAEAHGSEPGIEAMRDAVEGALGLRIQYYVLIDMQGFSDLIDALGGITIDVKERLPIGGGVDDNGNPVTDAWLEKGVQHMDGNHALWYARSRHGTSDYDRMARQREVQQAMLNQLDPVNVLLHFREVAAAGAQVVKTDIPQAALGRFLDLAIGAKGKPITDVEFVPDLIDPANPDWEFIHQKVKDTLAKTS